MCGPSSVLRGATSKEAGEGEQAESAQPSRPVPPREARVPDHVLDEDEGAYRSDRTGDDEGSERQESTAASACPRYTGRLLVRHERAPAQRCGTAGLDSVQLALPAVLEAHEPNVASPDECDLRPVR